MIENDKPSYDDDERCHCCSRETEEADLRCLSKAFCLSSSQWSIFATVLWIILQVFCCCFLPITLIIMYCSRRKGRRVYVNRNNGYGNNNTRNIEMQTLGYQNTREIIMIMNPLLVPCSTLILQAKAINS